MGQLGAAPAKGWVEYFQGCDKLFLVSGGNRSCCHLSPVQLTPAPSSSRKNGAPSAGSSEIFLHLLGARCKHPQGCKPHKGGWPQPCACTPRCSLPDTGSPLGHPVLPGAGRACPEHSGQRSEARQCRSGAETSIYLRRPRQGQACGSSIAPRPTSDCPQPAAKLGRVLASLSCPETPLSCPQPPDSASPLPGVTLACSWQRRGAPLQLRDCYRTHHPGRLSRTAPAHRTAWPLFQPSSKKGSTSRASVFAPVLSHLQRILPFVPSGPPPPSVSRQQTSAGCVCT